MGGGKKAQEGGDICISMIHVDVWQKSTQYCIILQLKIKKKIKNKKILLKEYSRDFPSGPEVKTLHFHCSGHRFNPQLGKFYTLGGAAK